MNLIKLRRRNDSNCCRLCRLQIIWVRLLLPSYNLWLVTSHTLSLNRGRLRRETTSQVLLMRDQMAVLCSITSQDMRQSTSKMCQRKLSQAHTELHQRTQTLWVSGSSSNNVFVLVSYDFAHNPELLSHLKNPPQSHDAQKHAEKRPVTATADHWKSNYTAVVEESFKKSVQ